MVDQAAVSEITVMAGSEDVSEPSFQPWYGVAAIALTSALLVQEHRRRKRRSTGATEDSGMSRQQLCDHLFSDDRWLDHGEPQDQGQARLAR